MNTAFIGLGVMGYPMAGHMAQAGHCVQIYNRTDSVRARWLGEYAGSDANSATEAVADAEIVCMCLGNDDDVRSVACGAQGLIAGMAPGSILIDHTTTSADLAHELAKDCQERGIGFLDAPVSGGQSGAEQGILTVMVGGEASVLERARSVINSYAKHVTLMGGTGSGQLAKMVNQICIAGVLQGLSEGLNFAMNNNIDCAALLHTISKGAAQSWQMENRGTTMVADTFDFGFSVQWMIKDLNYCLQQGQRSGSDLPITEQVLARYQQLAECGRSGFDTSSLITLLREPK